MNLPDRIEVNAAIRALLDDPFNSEAARVLIQFGNTIPPSKSLVIKRHILKTTDKSLTGHTQEQGNVTIRQEDQEEREEFSYGWQFERVGFYKIWRAGRGLICFQHFWKADLTTKGIFESPTVYSVLYNPRTLAYKDLREEIEVQIFSIGGLSLGASKWKSLKNGRETFYGVFLRFLSYS